MDILQIENVTKRYSAHTALNDVSLNVPRGSVYGLLGPNGAGKTTTFYMIVGLIKPNDGKIFLEDDNGNITDITVDYSENYVEQMLRYSKDYSPLTK